jgi:hypothetical protein
MTIEQQIETADGFAKLWHLLMPDFQIDLEQFCIWAGQYSPATVTKGINRTGSKTRKQRFTENPMSSNDAERYSNSVMRREHELESQHHQGQA